MTSLRKIVNSALLAGALGVASAVSCPQVAQASEEPKDTSAVAGQVGAGSVKSKPKKFYKGDVSTSVGYSNFDIGGMKYQDGVSLGIEGNFDFNVMDWLAVYGGMQVDHQEYWVLGSDDTETVSELEIMLGGRLDIPLSSDFKLYLGFGGKYSFDREGMIFEGTNAHLTKNLGGPVLAAGFEWKHLDLSVSFSHLLGLKTSSYDLDRGYLSRRLEVKLVPKFWKVEVPIEWKLSSGSIDSPNAEYPDYLTRFTLRPGVKVTDHIVPFVSFADTISWGAQGYNVAEIGGGVKVKW